MSLMYSPPASATCLGILRGGKASDVKLENLEVSWKINGFNLMPGIEAKPERVNLQLRFFQTLAVHPSRSKDLAQCQHVA